jgi:drug/metabolite transporter (DMT)-like permease
MTIKWLLIAIIVGCNATGDLLTASGMRRHGEITNWRPKHIVHLVVRLSRNFYVVGGVAMMIVAFFALLSLLSIAQLSFAVPATASSYMVETILAKYVLGEQISGQRWLGAALAAIGVALLSF